MTAISCVLSDDSLLSRIDRFFHRLERKLALAGGLAVFSLMFLAVISVSGRNLFNQPLPGYVDWIEQIMPIIAFMAISFSQREGGHIRMDILVNRLKGRMLWIFELITTLAILILVLLLIWGSFAHFERSFDFSVPLWSRDSSIDISLPLWPAKLIVPVAFSVLSFRLVLQIFGYSRAIIYNIANPVAVPLIEDAATQAAKEADIVLGKSE